MASDGSRTIRGGRENTDNEEVSMPDQRTPAGLPESDYEALSASAHRVQEAARQERGATDALDRAAPEQRIQKAAAFAIRRGQTNLALHEFEVYAHRAGILNGDARGDAAEVARSEARGDERD